MMQFNLRQINERISKTKQELEMLLTDPSKLLPGATRPDPVMLWMTSGLLILLSLYLFCFYVSAGMAAFFTSGAQRLESAQSGDLSALFHAVFDPNAFAQAWETRNVFLFLFPSLCLAFGIVFHDFHSQRKRAIAVTILTLTFLFDALIAYQITSRIHHLQVLTGITKSQWGLWIAIRDVNFWMIIALGFIAYVIWSLLLNHWSEIRTNPVFRAIAQRKQKLEDVKLFPHNTSKGFVEIGEGYEVRNLQFKRTAVEDKTLYVIGEVRIPAHKSTTKLEAEFSITFYNALGKYLGGQKFSVHGISPRGGIYPFRILRFNVSDKVTSCEIRPHGAWGPTK